MSLLIKYKLEGKGPTIVLIHGLFGNLDNLGVLARELKNTHQVLSIDLRNHGQSFHSEQHDYTHMAQDVVVLLNYLAINSVTLIGHSMGGKVAMTLAGMIPKRIHQSIILDMAPVAYVHHQHDNVFTGLNAVIEQQPHSRPEAMAILARHIHTNDVRQFLGKSLIKQNDVMTFRFNTHALEKNYSHILNWDPIPMNDVPTLFIKGERSDYLQPEHQSMIQQQFSNAKAHIISGTGHWLHAEKPFDVLRVIKNFIHKHPS